MWQSYQRTKLQRHSSYTLQTGKPYLIFNSFSIYYYTPVLCYWPPVMPLIMYRSYHKDQSVVIVYFSLNVDLYCFSYIAAATPFPFMDHWSLILFHTPHRLCVCLQHQEIIYLAHWHTEIHKWRLSDETERQMETERQTEMEMQRVCRVRWVHTDSSE